MGTPLVDLEVDLTTNALAFLKRAVYQLTVEGSEQDEIESLTFAIVDVAIALELLLKARLAREHWSLIIANVDRANEASLVNGAAATVTPDQAVTRLKEISHVAFGDGADSRTKQIERMIKLRNRAAHFTVAGEAPAGLRAQIGEGLAAIMWFLETHSRTTRDAATAKLVDDLIEEVAAQLSKIEDFKTVRMSELADRLEAAPLLLACPTCREPALIVEDLASCAFCLAAGEDGSDIADGYVSEILGLSSYVVYKDGGEWPVHECPDCGAEALVEGVEPESGRGDDRPPWACFACGLISPGEDLRRCGRCGRIDRGDPCRDCLHALIHDD